MFRVERQKSRVESRSQESRVESQELRRELKVKSRTSRVRSQLLDFQLSTFNCLCDSYFQLSTFDFRLSTTFATFNCLSKSVQHARYFPQFVEGCFRGIWSDISQISADHEKVLSFYQRCFGDIQESRVFLVALSLGALSNIRRNGQDRSSKLRVLSVRLRSQAEAFVGRKTLGEAIDPEDQPVATLPDRQIGKSLHGKSRKAVES